MDLKLSVFEIKLKIAHFQRQKRHFQLNFKSIQTLIVRFGHLRKKWLKHAAEVKMTREIIIWKKNLAERL